MIVCAPSASWCSFCYLALLSPPSVYAAQFSQFQLNSQTANTLFLIYPAQSGPNIGDEEAESEELGRIYGKCLSYWNSAAFPAAVRPATSLESQPESNT